ncbi:outer membrane protein assembly factor BamB family protein [Nocardiopsis suaedae]|uniref:PQQ-binding-like beta-propeller repeat protein n=1 Tax=Nocardiopsis suaedae TaxID=3018444 RepID=A0ABT4TFJ3_9ACTN|nr:PQQ-binding-like beta-propeller repeat protein [Nocardiopsis suaedae]MDA2803074.1 PQQ-binding-like beta-propeller repeat protein [Nocardiopsis suaedae]
MARHGIALATAFTFLIPLSACSFFEEPLNLDFEATAISPDKPFACDGADACDEPGAVRWSLPLEGDYFLYWRNNSSPSIFASSDPDNVSGAYGEGVFYFTEGNRITAVDTAGPAVLWTEAIDPDRAGDISYPHMVGDDIILVAEKLHENDDDAGVDDLMYVVDPGSAGWQRVDISSRYYSDPFLRDDGTHVLVKPSVVGENLIVDVDDGSVAWSGYFEETDGASEVLSDESAAITDDAAYTFTRMPVRGHFTRILRWDTGTGELAETIELGDGVDIPTNAALVAANSEVLLASTGNCEATPCSSPGGLWGLDPRTGEPLWERSEGSDEEAIFIALEGGEHGDTVFVQGLDGAPFALDPKTGEEVDTAVAPRHLPHVFGSRDTVRTGSRFLWSDTRPDRQERLSAPLQATGPGLWGGEEFLVDFALGTRFLTSYTEDGSVMGVFLACAPDGLKAVDRGDIDATEQCTSPRLFAVDYGI